MPMPADPKSHARAALLAGAMVLEPQAIQPFAVIVRAVRRIMPRVTPPLDLAVNPFHYRLRGRTIEVIRPICGHEHKSPGARSRK